MCLINCMSQAFVVKVKNIPLVREISATRTVVGVSKHNVG